MFISEKTVGDVTILEIHGKVTEGEENKKLRYRIEDLAENGRKKIILNFDGLNNVNTSGIYMFKTIFNKAINQGGKIVFLSLNKKLEGLFVITESLTVFDLYSTEKEAIASFN